MEPLELSQTRLANELGVSVSRVRGIVHGRSKITVDMAIRLGRFFKTGPELWLNLQQHYDLKIAKSTIEPEIKRHVSPIAMQVQ